MKPGGRLAISDVVAIAPIPDDLSKELLALTGCVSGAAPVRTVRELLSRAGFDDVRVDMREESKAFIRDWISGSGSGAENYVASATIEAVKPDGKTCCAPSCCGGAA